MQAKSTKEFSGGWRMRISLAQALFMTPDLLLLDEPTNHLDVHALTWLEEFLQRWEKTVVIVSHDRGFLNDTTTATMFLHHKKLRYYGGNYDTFVKVRSEHRANEEATRANQSQREGHLKNFIQKFGQGHKKMVKQAQCRMKMLAKLQEEKVDVDYDDPYLRLNFPSATPLPPPCISVMNAAFGYEGYETLYEGLDFGLDMDSRVAIVGPNGAGKSTFLKLLEGAIIPTRGWVNRHTKLRLARFSQHHLETMNLEEDCVCHMKGLDSEMPLEEARAYLGRFGLRRVLLSHWSPYGRVGVVNADP
jgi:ATP-binding cassette subfamily F protein 2